VTAIVSIWLALVLVAAAVLKAWRPQPSAGALATYGLVARPAQRVAIWLLVCSEATLAVGLAAGASWGRVGAAVPFACVTAVTAVALAAGRGGRPCACFGSSSRLGWRACARAGALAALAAAVALGALPDAPAGYDRWLTLGLSLALALLACLGVAVLALAREVGVLRLSAAGSRGALEIAEEGPAVGTAQPWSAALRTGAGAALRLAVFSSHGCPLCAQVAPAVAHVAGDPLVAVSVFDEHEHAAVWQAAGVPGSPYAVALSGDGVALAKGTFNSLGQLESVLATARSRQPGLSVAA
jgi:hypothetical protein